MRELQKPEVLVRLPATFKDRPNCKHGRKCTRQENERHGKKCEHRVKYQLLIVVNHICEPLPADEAAKLHQDDSAPAKTTAPPPGADSSLSSESPQESDSDSDDDGPSYVDAETQYEANPHGTVISVSAQHPMLPKWLPDSQGIAPLSIANILNLDAPIRGSSSSSSPIHRPLSPHPALRVSGSASTPLAGSFSWPSIYRRAETPPLGMSTASNIGSADSELAVTTASKLSIPLSPTPVKGQSRDHSTAIDVDM
jgi:hypothetical protein